MKKLYYLEFAEIVDKNNNPVAVKKLKWFTPASKMVAFEDPDKCMVERFMLQRDLVHYLVAIRPAGFFKGLKIRFSAGLHNDWVIEK